MHSEGYSSCLVCVCVCVCVCGFRKGRGCIDQVYILRILAEKAREFNTPLYLAFVDLKKAYDSVSREALWMILQEKYNLPNKLVNIIRALHHGTRGAVRALGRVSDDFSIATGVRQEDVLAPTLFNLFFDAVVATTTARHPHQGIKVLYNHDDKLVGSRRMMRDSVVIQDLEYADDMALVSDSMDVLDSPVILWFDLQQIATKVLSTVSGTEKCAL